jgi:phospholipid/cholesterol/gamma-HCH transport system substrate-binding protein
LKRRREIKIAVVFVAALALFFWGVNFLKGRDILKKQRVFYAIYDQVSGLVDANPVVINGFKVGKVQDIYFHPDGSGRILVKFMVSNNDIEIPKNSIARLFSSDIMGSRAIEIQLGRSSEKAASGDTLKTLLGTTLGEEVSNQMLPIKEKFQEVMASLDSVLVIIQFVFNEGTRQNLVQSFESIKMTIQNLEHTTQNIDTLVRTQRTKLSAIIGNVESITTNLKKNNDKITNIIENFSSISDTLAKVQISNTINNVNKAISEFSSIIEKINAGEGSVGMLINNESLYKNLESSSKELDELIEDLKLNPQRYLNFSIFGKGGKKNQYEPKEE